MSYYKVNYEKTRKTKKTTKVLELGTKISNKNLYLGKHLFYTINCKVGCKKLLSVHRIKYLN